MTTATHSGPTIGEINEQLEDAGFPKIGPDSARRMLEFDEKSTILNAIRKAKVDRGAKNYLVKLFAKINSEESSSEHQPVVEGQNSEQSNVDSGCNEDSNSATNDSVAEDHKHQKSWHIYGSKAALCFEVDSTRNGFPTISIDAAINVGSRRFDWGNKTRIQLTHDELPNVLAVLIGVQTRFECKSHGAAKNKSVILERQAQGNVFVKVFEGNTPVKAVPCSPASVFHITALFIKQMRLAYPWLSGQELFNMVRVTVGGNS